MSQSSLCGGFSLADAVPFTVAGAGDVVLDLG